MFSLTGTAIDTNALSQSLQDNRAGAFVCFEGRVRNHNDGRQVDRLEYEAFEELALKEGKLILEEAQSRFALVASAAVHRTGDLSIGDVAVWVGVITVHRAEAFEACRFIIDEIKHRLPVWKREHYTDGTAEWVNCATCGAHAGALSSARAAEGAITADISHDHASLTNSQSKDIVAL